MSKTHTYLIPHLEKMGLEDAQPCFVTLFGQEYVAAQYSQEVKDGESGTRSAYAIIVLGNVPKQIVEQPRCLLAEMGADREFMVARVAGALPRKARHEFPFGAQFTIAPASGPEGKPFDHDQPPMIRLPISVRYVKRAGK
jgi:hypothetical protein